MSENVIIAPLFHQRSHSMPVGRTFINENPIISHGNGGGSNGGGGSNAGVIVDGHYQTFDYNRSSPLKPDNSTNIPSKSTQLTTSEGFPLPIRKSLTTQFHTSSLNHPTAANSSEHSEANNNGQEVEPEFFCQPNNILSLFNYSKKTGSCPIILNCKMDKGFFVSQLHWTCYRRNYFQVTASFIIPGHSDQTYYALQLKSDSPVQPVQQFFLRLKACTSASSNNVSEPSGNSTSLESHGMVRPVALTQMTPKRDKGPQREPPIIPINPSDSGFGNEQVCVTFERLQFRVATANNGKRRASQQYFRLIFELIAQLDDSSQHVVSECYSSPLVVRGRSPGHYSSEPERDLRKKKKMTPPSISRNPQKKDPSSSLSCSPSPRTTVGTSTTVASTASPCTVNSNSPPSPSTQQQYSHVVTLPPPQYVYNPPSLVVDTQRQSSNENTSSSLPTSANSHISFHTHNHHHQQQQHHHQQHLMPHMINSAFTNFHARSQSANDTELFARHRNGYKYQPVVDHHHHHQQQDDIFDNYNAGIERALKNWQQQVARQRTDSAATFDSYMSSTNEHGNRPNPTKPNTPISYHAQQHQQQFYDNNSWPSAAAAAAVPPTPSSLSSHHHYEEKYQPQQQQELSPKLYQQPSR